jgi:DNA-binding NtrC family response regulator
MDHNITQTLSLKEKPILLAVIEQGGYPDFTPIYKSMGYSVVTVTTPRKAISYLKKNKVDMMIAEFNYQTDFRDRTSSLESIMASTQHQSTIHVIILLDKNNSKRFLSISSRFTIHQTLIFPFNETQLKAAINSSND